MASGERFWRALKIYLLRDGEQWNTRKGGQEVALPLSLREALRGPPSNATSPIPLQNSTSTLTAIFGTHHSCAVAYCPAW